MLPVIFFRYFWRHLLQGNHIREIPASDGPAAEEADETGKEKLPYGNLSCGSSSFAVE